MEKSRRIWEHFTRLRAWNPPADCGQQSTPRLPWNNTCGFASLCD